MPYIITVGYPDECPKPTTRKNVEETSF